jgi:isopenicillin-N epimerase
MLDLNETITRVRLPDCDGDWRDLASLWSIRPDTTYLNHGSFGPSPRPVRDARRHFINAVDEQPMDFYVRQFEPLLIEARRSLAQFVGTKFENLVFTENATFAMNVVADSFRLNAGDEVLLNDHEYGAVHRIWERACARAGASARSVTLANPMESREQVIESIISAISPKTKLVIVSHITSPTAIILPVEQITAACRDREVAVCIDGPHAQAQIDVNLDELDCDFYCASCHKWLCAPLGTGFLYANPRWHHAVKPQQQSWGRLLPNLPIRWDEQFTWSGTRDPSGYLAVPTAIEFISTIGLDVFRSRCYWLARYAEQRLIELSGERPIAPIQDKWYGTMCHVPLPDGDWTALQDQLWQQYQIEVPIIYFANRWFVRVSCHFYNTTTQIDKLIAALRNLTAR